VQSVISREKHAAKFGVVTIGSVQAGNAGNVIPDTALLRGTIRSYDDDARARMIEGVERTAASEDYSEFIMAGVPSFYFGIGGLDPKAVAEAAATHTQLPGNHSPEFAPVPEPTIRTGTQAMSLVLLDVLQKK